MTSQESVLSRIDHNLDQSVDRLLELITVQSISTDSAYKEECEKACMWLVDDLNSMGFEARKVDTTGHPMVIAHHKKAPGAPHVLFYGHYDVQPVDPLDLWDNPPFEARVEKRPDGTAKITGRGSADDKGQLMTFVEACRAWIAETDGLPCNVTILFEGEEECGSPSLLPFLDAYSEELKADLALVCDTSMWDRETPAISTSLRGMLGEQINITAASRDLHSGYYGSAAANPIHLLADILASLRNANGTIQIPEFYEGVPEVPDSVRRQWDSLGFSESDFLGEIGLSIPAGEKDRTVLEQTWTRPTCEVNGIWGGYTGEGTKTVIPSQAHAKVTFRLVGQQDPDKIRRNFRQFVQDRIPGDCTVTFEGAGGTGAVHLDYNMPELHKAAAALSQEWGKETALIAMGGSIPIVGHFKDLLGMDSLLIGFGLADDRIHSPNEKYELSSFHKGSRSWARVLNALA